MCCELCCDFLKFCLVSRSRYVLVWLEMEHPDAEIFLRDVRVVICVSMLLLRVCPNVL